MHSITHYCLRRRLLHCCASNLFKGGLEAAGAVIITGEVEEQAGIRALNFNMPSEADIANLTLKHLSTMNAETAPGLDGVMAPFLKYALSPATPDNPTGLNVLAPLLGKLVYMLITGAKLPEAWGAAKLSALFKKDDVTIPSNYRLLAVSSVLYRLYTNVLRDVVTKWCVDMKVIPDTQFGFYPGGNAQQAQFILRHAIHLRDTGSKRADKYLFAAFIDFQQAYDTVDRSKLWAHLRNHIGLPNSLLCAVQALYAGDTYILQDGPKQTESIFPTQGVKQGCPLSPLLFSLFISDLHIPEQIGAGISLKHLENEPASQLSSILFADDLVLLGTSQADVQRMLDWLGGYANRKGLTVNVSKCRVMCFNPGNSCQDVPR